LDVTTGPKTKKASLKRPLSGGKMPEVRDGQEGEKRDKSIGHKNPRSGRPRLLNGANIVVKKKSFLG
jgi:hypothetical protein